MEKIEKEVIIVNKKGLHARPAALFLSIVEKLGVTVTLTKGAETVKSSPSEKSIMGILMLAAVAGTVLKVTVEGNQAAEAMAEIEKFFNKQEEELAP